MSKRKWISLLLSFTLVFSFVQSVRPEVKAEEADTFTSQALTLNGEAATWTVLGEKPETFGDQSNPARFEYWSANEMNFELQHEMNGLTEGSYKLSLELFSNDSTTGGNAYAYATTSKGTYYLPLDYTGSQWEMPAIISLAGIEVGSDGTVLLGIKIESSSDHYGYIRNLQFIEGSSLTTGMVKPNSAILRPGRTVQLHVPLQPEQEVNFSSNNTEVAVVNETGLIEAISDGEATITASIREHGEVIAYSNTAIFVSTSLQSNYGEIQVKPIDELEGNQRAEFMMGADISMLDALSAIDRKFYNHLGEEKPLLELLKENGVNWIRLRAWVNPADEQGNPYGGGNVDTAALIRMASQVKEADLKLLVDLHYSDFWTDPGRQSLPKSWVKDTEQQTADELEQEVYQYTYNTLQALYDESVYPDMIQIGNEINGGMLWPYGNSPEKAKPYLEQGIKAVRDFEEAVGGEHIDIVLHRANPGDGLSRVRSFYSTFTDLDYDVIGLSYYPFWHGTINNLQEVMDSLAEEFNKEIAIVETSYAYTLESPIYNGPTAHIFGQAQQEASNYLASPQGQANAIRDVIAAVAAVPNNKGIGIFYWEPAWLMGTDTGWGTAYASAYQKEEISADGGSGWANQALFNYFGEALPSLSVFKAVRAASDEYVPPMITEVNDIELTTSQGIYVELPLQVRALFSDDTYRDVNVLSWSPQNYDHNTPGQYVLTGTLANDEMIKATVTVRPKNYVVNPSIEDSNMSAWQLVNAARSSEAAYAGQYAIHFWNQATVTAKQVITDLPDGIYELSVQTRIGIDEETIADTSVLYAAADEKTYSAPLEITGWDKWKQIVVSDIVVTGGQLEIGVIVNNALNDYGDFDDWELIRIGDLVEPMPSPTADPEPTSSPTADPEPTPNPTADPEPTPNPTADPEPTPSPTADPVPTSSPLPSSSPKPSSKPSTPSPSAEPTPSATPTITKTEEDGKTVFTVTVSEQMKELSIPLADLSGHQNAELVINWGGLTFNINVAELIQQETITNGNLIITRPEQKEKQFKFKGSAVTSLDRPLQWQLTFPANEARRLVMLPIGISSESISKLTSNASVPASSVAVYKVEEDGSLTYVKAVRTNQNENGIVELETGGQYVIAAVTRSFTDESEQSDALRRLVAAGLIEGDQNGAVKLQKYATRAEVSKLTAMLLDLMTGSNWQQHIEAAKSFNDLPNNHWAKPYIDRLTSSGILLGFTEQSFAPNERMSYEALCLMVARILQLPLDDNDLAASLQANQWAKPAIAAVIKAGLLPEAEDEVIDYTQPVTRAKLFEVIDMLLNKLY